MQLYAGISQLALPQPDEGRSRAPVEVIVDAALLVDRGMVVAAGRAAEVTALPQARGAKRILLGDRAVVPGLIDSHTHLVFAGDRIDDMARRSRGETYEQIAAAGGGIQHSAQLLRAASPDTLMAEALPRLQQMLSCGTTTCEVKSGYGLEPQAELKQLQVVRRLAETTVMSLFGTVLAHLVPAGQERPAYIDRLVREVMDPAARDKLASFCDVFVEAGAFTPDEARRIAYAAKRAGLRLKLHVDQLHDGDGAALAAELGALSADHLEFTSAQGRHRLAEAGVVATLLPGCTLFLGKGPWPDGRSLRDAGCEVAIATDCNPGSSMITDLTLCATLGATRCGLSVEEALWAVTAGGAKALGLTDRGRLARGERADFVVVNHTDWRALFYRPGDPPVWAVAVAGKWAVTPPKA